MIFDFDKPAHANPITLTHQSVKCDPTISCLYCFDYDSMVKPPNNHDIEDKCGSLLLEFEGINIFLKRGFYRFGEIVTLFRESSMHFSLPLDESIHMTRYSFCYLNMCATSE
jgi:hypothetical protein